MGCGLPESIRILDKIISKFVHFLPFDSVLCLVDLFKLVSIDLLRRNSYAFETSLFILVHSSRLSITSELLCPPDESLVNLATSSIIWRYPDCFMFVFVIKTIYIL